VRNSLLRVNERPVKQSNHVGLAMAYNFLPCDRDQGFLLPPDVRDWLPADHLAWFVLDVVDQLDLGPFLAAYRADGHGRAAYDPRMLLAVLLYGYCTGIRSSRQLERRCHEDVAFRVLSGNSTPDHVTFARFRVRHEQTLAGLLVASLKLCAAAGLVRLGLVCLDGTKLAANAAAAANRTHAKLQRQVDELLAQHAAADRADDRADDQEDEQARRAALPRALAARTERLERLQRAKAQLEADAAARRQRYQQRVATLSAAARARGEQPKAHYRPRPRDEAPTPEATVNTTDPDSRLVRGNGRTVQGYNAQAAATTDQIVVAAELTQQANDVRQLAPMLAAIGTTLTSASVDDEVQRLAADSGYWSIANVSTIPNAPQLLIPPSRAGRHGKPRKDGKPSASTSDGLRAAMRATLDEGPGKAYYAQRSRTIEPVFGQIKTVQSARRFMRRGLRACQAEWKLLCGTHNLLKLWRTMLTATG
jgi:transposase